jgi:hypothetical protein
VIEVFLSPQSPEVIEPFVYEFRVVGFSYDGDDNVCEHGRDDQVPAVKPSIARC